MAARQWHRCRRMLKSGAVDTAAELAAAESTDASYVSRALRLTLLAPDMVEAVLDGRQPEGITLPALMEGVAIVWGEQRAALTL